MSTNLHLKGPFELRGNSLVFRAQSTRPFSTVFVSSTRRDLEAERQVIKDKVVKRIQVSCLLGEEMVSGYVPVVDECLKKVDEAAGFIGVFAYWYGSVLKHQQLSVTHLEFRRAVERLKNADDDLPMIILMPKELSPAKDELEKRARNLIQQFVGDDAAKRKEHDERLKLFHDEVRGGRGDSEERIVQEFETYEELYEIVLVKCQEWKGLTLMRAAQGEVEVREIAPRHRLPTEEELGLLGRDEHFKAITKALAVTAVYPEEPALALLASGDEDAGQRSFLQHLLTTDEVRAGRPPQIVRPPDGSDAAGVVQQLGDSLGLAGAATPQGLAEAVHTELRQQQLCFVLDQVNRFAGGAGAFREQVWLPLYTRLKELRAEYPTEHRLLGFVADYSGRKDTWDGAVEDLGAGADPDYSCLLRLPALGPFNKLDLMLWMNALKVPDKPPGENPGHRGRIADAVLKNAEGVNYDGTPLRVFARLRSEDLWPEGEE